MELSLDSSPTYLRSLLVGMIFAAGWTPCVGPLLGAILTLALDARSVWQAVFFLSVEFPPSVVLFFILHRLSLSARAKWAR